MRLVRVASLLLMALTLFTRVAFAEEETPPTPEQLKIQIEILKEQIVALQKENGELREVTGAIGNGLSTPLIELKKKEYAYYAELMEVNLQAFYAQKVASYVVLLLVFVVVGSGVVFSGFQLWKSVAVAGVQMSNELELSASKVRVTSSVVGIIVLTISLVFLYIYTQEIYHIKVIDTATTPPVSSTTKP